MNASRGKVTSKITQLVSGEWGRLCLTPNLCGFFLKELEFECGRKTEQEDAVNSSVYLLQQLLLGHQTPIRPLLFTQVHQL